MAIRLLYIFARAVFVTIVIVCVLGFACRFLMVDGETLGVSEKTFGFAIWGISFVIAVIEATIHVRKRKRCLTEGRRPSPHGRA